MRIASFLPAAVVLLGGCGSPAAPPTETPGHPPSPPAAETLAVGSRSLALGGPFVHGNLAVYSLVGGAADTREYLSLDRGLADAAVVVAEKKGEGGRDAAQVNELVLENRSERWLFLQAGDVVKGGKQDRVVAQDMLVPPKSGPQPLSAFCVEHGRWQADGDVRARGEIVFASNTALVNGPSLKAAIQKDSDQQKVWQQVAENNQEIALQGSGGGGFDLPATGTYNAVLGHREVMERRDAAVKALLDRVLEGDRTVGMAIAIDGEIVGVETYASPGLFRAMARKVLESYALDAVLAEKDAKAAGAAPGPAAVRDFVAEAAKGAAKDEALRGSMRRRVLDGKVLLGFEYRVPDQDDAVHASYLRK